MAERGVELSGTPDGRVRAVTHLDVDRAAIDEPALEAAAGSCCYPDAPCRRSVTSCGKGPAFGHSRSHSDGGHQAALQPEPPEGPHLRRGRSPARVRLHSLPEGLQGHQGRLSAGPSRRVGVKRQAWPRREPRSASGASWQQRSHELESRRQEVNDLNVFPVADGDTGDNMALTLRAVVDELDALDGEPIDGS